MPAHRFQPGKSGNPSGRPKSFLSKAVKEDQFRKSFRKLVVIRDGFIKQLEIAYDEEAKPVEAYAVANIKEIINALQAHYSLFGGLACSTDRATAGTGPVKINILVGNQILLGETNGSQLRLHPAGQSDAIDSRASPRGDSNGSGE